MIPFVYYKYVWDYIRIFIKTIFIRNKGRGSLNRYTVKTDTL